mgnify:CR=1 FL=1
MPLPLIVPVVLGVAGLFGLGKTTKALIDNSKADDISESAKSLISKNKNILRQQRYNCNDKLRVYGERKLQILSQEIQTFIDNFGQLKNVNLARSLELDCLYVGEFAEINLAELRHSCSFASEFALSTTTGVGAGALTAFGAYNGTMLLASAGTGTAISSLGGVAASNATLAWLGSGTLAAGGYGVAGGTMVLGVLVAGPALLVLGSVLGARASKKLDDASANLEKAKTYEKEVEVVCEKLNAIIEVTTLAADTLNALRKRLNDANRSLGMIIENSGIDYSKYNDPDKKSVFQAVKYAQLVKKVIDTPILKEDGSLAEKTLTVFTDTRNIVDAIS